MLLLSARSFVGHKLACHIPLLLPTKTPASCWKGERNLWWDETHPSGKNKHFVQLHPPANKHPWQDRKKKEGHHQINRRSWSTPCQAAASSKRDRNHLYLRLPRTDRSPSSPAWHQGHRKSHDNHQHWIAILSSFAMATKEREARC